MQATAASVEEASRHTQGLLLMVQSYLYHGLIEALWSLSLFLLVFVQGHWRSSETLSLERTLVSGVVSPAGYGLAVQAGL
jgi:hypothetical protein